MGAFGRTRGKARSRSVIIILAALSLVGTLATPSGAYPRPGKTLRVSVATGGVQAEYVPFPQVGDNVDGCVRGRVFSSSADGRYVAFATRSELVPNDDNLLCDVFVHDLKTRVTELVSAASDGTGGIGHCVIFDGSWDPAISANGRFVAFTSCSTNLVPGDTNANADVFLHDRREGSTVLVSRSSKGEQAFCDGVCIPAAQWGSVNNAGRKVAFQSYAANLVEDDTNGNSDVFVRDIVEETTTRVSVTSSGAQASFPLYELEPANLLKSLLPHQSEGIPSISANGRFVVFDFDAPLVASDVNDIKDVYVHDLSTRKTELVSVSSDGTPINPNPVNGVSRTGNMGGPPVSADGRFVIFSSRGENLVPSDRNRSEDIFIRDRALKRTVRISVLSDGREPTCHLTSAYGVVAAIAALGPAISSDGRRAVFDSTCAEYSSAVDTPTFNGDADVYAYDISTGALEWVSVAEDGGESRSESCEPSVSRSGAITNRNSVVFHSCSDNLVPDDTNDFHDVFVRDLGPDVGVGNLGESSPKADPPNDRICIDQIDVCIPPGAAASSSDDAGDLDEALTKQGANASGASLAYRPQYKDLFGAIELEYMPKVIPGISPIFYGLRFEVEDKSFEVRATSLNFGRFGLFDCTNPPTCTKVADLRGGYGTTGMRVVFSLPLEEIGLESGGELKDVEAFSGFGTFGTGAAKVLDRVQLR